MTVPFKRNLPRITVFLKFEIHKGTECLEATGSNNSQTWSRMLQYHIEDFSIISIHLCHVSAKCASKPTSRSALRVLSSQILG